MSKVCDNKSVGLIVEDSVGRILLIKRAKFPPGYACPAGHVDGHGTWLQAAIAELQEEVGLEVRDIRLVHEETHNNPCRRKGGTHHDWRVYSATTEDHEVLASEDETSGFVWADTKELNRLSNRAMLYRTGGMNDTEWEEDPGLEPIWDDILRKIGIVA